MVKNPGKTNLLGTLSQPKHNGSAKIAIISDCHIALDDGEYLHRPKKHLQAVIDDIGERDVDGVIFNGDQSKNCDPEEYEVFDEIVSDISAPTITIPGNHDVPKSWDEHEVLSFDEFKNRYAPEGYPVVEKMGGLDLIGLNSAIMPDGSLARTSSGQVSSEQIEQLDHILSTAENPIIACHHSLTGIINQSKNFIRKRYPSTELVELTHETLGCIEEERGLYTTTRNTDELVAVLEKHDVPLVITGHLHMPGISRELNVCEISSPSPSAYPLAYLLLDVDEKGTTIYHIPIAESSEIQNAYLDSVNGPPIVENHAAMAAIRLADFPLINETPSEES